MEKEQTYFWQIKFVTVSSSVGSQTLYYVYGLRIPATFITISHGSLCCVGSTRWLSFAVVEQLQPDIGI